MVIPLVFWVVLLVFPLGGHDTDTYRTVAVGHGAFELCLPSLGFFFTKLVLRTQLLGQRCRMMCWGEDRRFGHPGVWFERHVGLQHYTIPRVGYAGVAVAAGHWVFYTVQLDLVCLVGSRRMVSHGNSVGDGWASQIGTLVSVGRPNLKHQWVSHREHRSW